MNDKKKLRDAVIVDIDDACTYSRARRNISRTGGANVKCSFYNSPYEVENDQVVPTTIETIQHLLSMGIVILFVTERGEKLRDSTVTWMAKNNIFSTSNVKNSRLFMRDDNDFRIESVIKKHLYEEHIKNRYNVLFCIDDSKRVAKMWTKEGLPCVFAGLRK